LYRLLFILLWAKQEKVLRFFEKKLAFSEKEW